MAEAAIMKAIREAVPDLTEDTVMKKIIPVEDIGKYLGEDGYSTIQDMLPVIMTFPTCGNMMRL